MKIAKCLLLIPTLLLVGCQKELDSEEVKSRISHINANSYLPLFNNSVDFTYTYDSALGKGEDRVTNKVSFHFMKEDTFGVYYKQTGNLNNPSQKDEFMEYYSVTDADETKIKYYNYNACGEAGKATYKGKTLMDDEKYLPENIQKSFLKNTSKLQDIVEDYRRPDSVTTSYTEYAKYYANGDEGLKVVVNFVDKDMVSNSKDAEFIKKREIVAIYSDAKLTSYKETQTTTYGNKITTKVKISYKKPTVNLPSDWKDYIKD